MRVVFAGTPEAALPSLDAVAASRHHLVGVLTRPDAPAGRGRRLTPSPVAVRALGLGVPVLTPEHPRDPGFLDDLRRLAPDCCAVVAYGALLPRSALTIPRHGWVNLHFSALPAWRGAAPVQHAIRAGDEVTGATTFRLVEALDAGPTYGVMTERIRPSDTAGDLLGRLAEGGAGLLVATLDGIEDGTLEARPQPADGVTLAPKVTVDDARVDWTHPAEAIDRQVRSCTPDPGAWTVDPGGARLRLGPLRPDGAVPPLDPGVLVVGRRTVHVGTGSVPVLLGAVTPLGRREMSAVDWTRGARPAPGARLGQGSRRPRGSVRAVSTRRARPEDVDEICGALPETELGTSWGDVPTWKVPRGEKGKGFVLYRPMHRSAVDPETGEMYDDLLVIITPTEAEKRALVEDDATPFFTIDHFRGYDAVLVQQSRLGELTRDELAEVITDAWARRAPKRLVRDHLGG